MNAEKLELAETSIEATLRQCSQEYAESVRKQIEIARARVGGALSTPARKRAERAFGRLLLGLEEETYASACARAMREREAQRTAEAFARGADYMTEQRMLDRIYMVCGL